MNGPVWSDGPAAGRAVGRRVLVTKKGMVLALTDKDIGVTGTTMRDRPWGYHHQLCYSLSG